MKGVVSGGQWVVMGRKEGTEAGPEEDFGHCGWELGVGMESG